MDVSWWRELLTKSVEGFAAEAGWRLALLLLEDEVTRRCGPRYSRPEVREVTRYGRQPGVVMIAGQKQAVLRPRIWMAPRRRPVRFGKSGAIACSFNAAKSTRNAT